MNWISISDENEVSLLQEKSFDQSVKAIIIFKHSTRCSISSMAKDRLERHWDLDPAAYPVFYVDVLASRPLSNKIADVFAIRHESPQLIILQKGKVIFSASHSEISFPEIRKIVNN
jgi:bacillithiol system protein YtxJ